MTRLAGRTIELWVEARSGRPAVNPVMGLLLAELIRSGASPSIHVAEEEVVDAAAPARRPDLVLLKSATTLALSRAVADEAAGVRFLNDAGATVEAHDKAVVIARLAASGIAVPPTFLLDASTNGKTPPGGVFGAWVAKPTRGIHGAGVTAHPSLEDAVAETPGTTAWESTIADDQTRLLQQYVGTGADVKVYAAGGAIYAGRKSFRADSYASDEVEPIELDDDTMQLVRRIGEALGLRLFGVDLRIDNDGRPVVIDVNPFPGYRGFPEAVVALHAEIEFALEDA